MNCERGEERRGRGSCWGNKRDDGRSLVARLYTFVLPQSCVGHIDVPHTGSPLFWPPHSLPILEPNDAKLAGFVSTSVV